MAKWRVCYKRSMHDRKSRGYQNWDAFKFFTDNFLEPDYAAFLIYKNDNEQSWSIFARILKTKNGNAFILIDADGNNISEPPFTTLSERFFTMYLKDNNPSPYNFICTINGRQDLKDIYKQLNAE